MATLEECFASLERQIALKNSAGLTIQGQRRGAFLLALAHELLIVQTPVIEILDELWAINDGRCAPPLGDDEVEALVRQALREDIARLRDSARVAA